MENASLHIRCVAGLGNPGPEYAGTRHNIGYEVVDALAIKLGWVASVDEFNRLAKVRFEALSLDGMAPDGEKLLLLMPMTYMNCSGRSVQAAIVELLHSLQRDLGLSMLFVTHNLPLVRSIAQRIAVMSHGRIVELGGVAQVLEEPKDEYTSRLLSDTPSLEVALETAVS